MTLQSGRCRDSGNRRILEDSSTEFSAGPWRISPRLGQVEPDDDIQHLEPEVMQVLVALAERPGEVFSKQQMSSLIVTPN